MKKKQGCRVERRPMWGMPDREICTDEWARSSLIAEILGGSRGGGRGGLRFENVKTRGH